MSDKEPMIFGRISLKQLFDAQTQFTKKLKSIQNKDKIEFDDIIELQQLYKKATLGLADKELEKPIRIMFLTGIIKPKLMSHLVQFIFLDVTRKALKWTEEVKRKPTIKQVKEL